MISKEQLSELFEGKLDALSNELNEKAETKIAGIVDEISEALLMEMTPGHKAMMKQHLDNVDVVDYTDEFGKPTKPKKTPDPRIKNIKRPDDRDAYNQLNDFQASKSGKNTNFVGKTYTTNERALRSEAVEIKESKFRNPIAAAHHANLYGDKKTIVKDITPSAETRKHVADVLARDKANDLARMKNKSVKESIEPLEELSKATLGRYIKKAHVSGKDASDASRSYDEMSNKMNKVGQTGEAKKMGVISRKWRNKEINRHVGINRATDKLVAKGDEEESSDNGSAAAKIARLKSYMG